MFRLKYPLSIFFSILVICIISINLINTNSHIVKRDLEATQTTVEQPTKRQDNLIQIFQFNVKNDANPTKLETNEKPWSTRKTGVIHAIKSRATKYPTLIGLQESVKHQIDDILEGLGSDYTYYGIARGTNTSDDEYNPIIYNKNEFELLYNKTYWLSETPEYPSISWGAKYDRIVTVTTFNEKSTNKNVNYLVSHFDFASEDARTNSAKEVLDIVDNKISNSDIDFFSGDLNAQQSEPAYSVITSQFTDANKASKKTRKAKKDFVIDYDAVIDYIFYKPNGNTLVQLQDYQVLNGLYDGYNISDHAPSYALFSL
ncbi:hypothetical protein HYPBUDRAFT_139637 [Hyphopichia burtonii NRRL Y-1933]|uniref:Endonuclease/exonuclease/phosphatase domain-containing protein n=1 Tax=Hyphopichia burtonii NRRL Y-1933 TaxID=984485 RepID=A0A1E4RIQ6_9ASCO|nr:hypothetical protein HYPBUDRAFT_139637 [Hyphopichia burtonii NRRL Y-1933]ODV67126.1 hypothetical protein HYPBUDRAFT_139637 [Hyphopichia burtonii NRRL Y-1933]